MSVSTEIYRRIRADFKWKLPAVYNIAAQIGAWAESHPDDIALIVAARDGSSRSYSYKHMERYSNRLANRLSSYGLMTGDRIAVLIQPSFEAGIAHLAALKMGLIIVPLYVGSTAASVQMRLRQSGAKLLLTDLCCLDVIEELDLSNDDQVLEVLAIRDGLAQNSTLLDAAIANAHDSFELVRTSPDDPAYLAFTSGSEGEPKGVLHGHREVIAACSTFGLRRPPSSNSELVWSTADWSWLMGLNVLFIAWQAGGSVLVKEDTRFNPRRAIELMTQFQVRHASLPPSALTLIQKTDTGEHRPSLKSLSTGGEALPPEIFDWVIERFGVVLDEFYGMSECPALIGNGNLIEARRGAMGVALPGHDVQVLGESGEIVPDGEVGYIAVHKSDPGLFLGYWRDTEIEKPRFVGDYYRTADLARRDGDGYFWYVGRADDVIKSSGYRIGPAEVEDCAILFKDVELAAAVGIEDALLGQAVKLWVQLSDPAEATESLKKRLYTHLRMRLPVYQVPKEIEFLSSLPLTPTGKINRRELRSRIHEAGGG